MLAGDHPAGVRGRDADTSLDVEQKPRRRHVRDGETPRKLATTCLLIPESPAKLGSSQLRIIESPTKLGPRRRA